METQEIVWRNPAELRSHTLQVRGKDPDVSDLTESVRQHGILEPLIITSTDAILAGTRRALAATKAGLERVPCIVRDDLAEGEYAVSAMVAENLNRRNLTPVEEAAAFDQLSGFGVELSVIAIASGRTTEDIERAITIARAPKAAKAAIAHDLNMEQAIGLAEFEDDKHMLMELTTVARQEPGQFDHELARARARRTQARVLAESQATLREAGVNVFEKRPSRDPSLQAIHYLLDDKGKEMTPAKHKKCPGHAAFVEVYWNEKPTITYYCTQPSLHKSMLSAGRAKGTLSEDELAERRKNRDRSGQFKVATGVRRKFVAKLYSSATLPRALVPAVRKEHALLSLNYNGLLPSRKDHQTVYTEMSKLGGIADAENRIEAASDKRLPSELLLLIAANAEWAWTHQFLSDDARRYVALLTQAGYELSEVETAQVAEADKSKKKRNPRVVDLRVVGDETASDQNEEAEMSERNQPRTTATEESAVEDDDRSGSGSDE